jgi:hypothetical protein
VTGSSSPVTCSSNYRSLIGSTLSSNCTNGTWVQTPKEIDVTYTYRYTDVPLSSYMITSDTSLNVSMTVDVSVPLLTIGYGRGTINTGALFLTAFKNNSLLASVNTTNSGSAGGSYYYDDDDTCYGWQVVLTGSVTSCPGTFTYQINEVLSSREVMIASYGVAVTCPSTFEIYSCIDRNQDETDVEIRTFTISLTDAASSFSIRARTSLELASYTTPSEGEDVEYASLDDSTFMYLAIFFGTLLVGIGSIVTLLCVAKKQKWSTIAHAADGRFQCRHWWFLLIIVILHLAKMILFTFSMIGTLWLTYNSQHITVLGQFSNTSSAILQRQVDIGLFIGSYCVNETNRQNNAWKAQQLECDSQISIMRNSSSYSQWSVTNYHNAEIVKRDLSSLINRGNQAQVTLAASNQGNALVFLFPFLHLP